MKLLLDIEDNKVTFMMELLNNFEFVKVEPLSPYKQEVLEGVRRAVEEMKLIKEGQLQSIPAQDLLDEL